MKLLSSLCILLVAPVLLAQPSVPFRVGEQAVYEVKFGMLNVGSGRMEVAGIDTIRGRPAWHLRLELRAGVPGFRVVDVLESWLDVEHLHSLRYREETRQGSKSERRIVEMFPSRKRYEEVLYKPGQNGGSGWAEARRNTGESVADPLDQASFLFFVRSQPLETGRQYSYDRYWKPSSNPVRLSVVRREQVTVPAGAFSSVVVRPVFQSKGIFGQNGRAEVWLTDDDRRLMVRMETHVAFGTITLQLKEFQ